eukprot:6190212-Pleurochrysis_carterae.AAC.4
MSEQGLSALAPEVMYVVVSGRPTFGDTLYMLLSNAFKWHSRKDTSKTADLRSLFSARFSASLQNLTIFLLALVVDAQDIVGRLGGYLNVQDRCLCSHLQLIGTRKRSQV